MATHHPVGARPDLATLRLAAKAWARGESGYLGSPLHGTCQLVGGRAASATDLELCVQLLYVGGAVFKPGDRGRADGVPLVDDLWTAALAAANPQALHSALDAAWVERPGARVVGRLPISRATRRVLAQPNAPQLTLSDLITRADVPASKVERELSALVALGFYRLRRAAGTGARKPAPVSAPPDPQMLRRLTREWELLKGADDWTVLGVPPSSGTALVERACLRMLARYDRLPSGDDEVGRLAARIQQRVKDAVDSVRAGRATSLARDAFMADPMSEGIRQAREGNWNAAARCFAFARKQAETSQNVAWLGWALYNDATRPGERWRTRGLELLALAESMGGASTEIQLLRARADLAERDYLRAWNRLERLSELDPTDVVVRDLLAEAKRSIKQQGKP